MNPTRTLKVLVLGVALITAPAVARAQTVVGTQNLSFGTVIPGVPTTVLRTDAVRAGQFRITGTGLYATVRITFALPNVMNGPLGATMPISFGSTDGGFTTPFLATNKAFDPRVPHDDAVFLGSATVFIGGRVNPSPTQRGGSYAANIVMTVIFP